MATYYELSLRDGSVREYPSEEAALLEVYSLVERGNQPGACDVALSRATAAGRSTAIAEGQPLVDRAIARFGSHLARPRPSTP